MQAMRLPKLSVDPILTLEDLGLDRKVGLDEVSRGLAEVSEAQIVRWVQFPAGALFFTLVPGDPESGGLVDCTFSIGRMGSSTGSISKTRNGAVTASRTTKS